MTIFGTAGPETIDGTSANETIDGLGGNDTLRGLDGNDSLIGGDGNDSIIEAVGISPGNNVLVGGNGDDTLTGGVGNDVLQGGNGNDVLIDGGAPFTGGANSLDGGDGNDTIFAGTNNSVDGGTGVLDIVDYSNSVVFAVLISLDVGSAKVGSLANDTIIGIEGAIGGAQSDTIIGTTISNFLDGSSGNDSIDGGAGSDTIHGSGGNDTLIGNDGNDSMVGGTGNDAISGSAGVDTLLGGEGDDTIFPILDATDGNDIIDGGAGNDVIYAGGGDDSIVGGSGNDTIDSGDLGGQNDTVDGGPGDDVIFGFIVDGGDGNDDLFAASNKNNNLNGGAGNDTIRNHEGIDTLTGGFGHDTFLVNEEGIPRITDFAPGDRIVIGTENPFAGVVTIGDGIATGAGQVQGLVIGDTTRLYFGVDMAPGADRIVDLTGIFALGSFSLSNDTFQSAPVGTLSLVTLPTLSIERVTVATGGTQGDGTSFLPALSADGRYVAFTSLAANLVAGDTNNVSDVFVHDRQADTIERVSIATGGDQGNGTSTDPSISADGRYVAFTSLATNLVPGDANFTTGVFIFDRQTDTITRVSTASAGAAANGESQRSSISADGRYVAFDSFASNLVPGDTNGDPLSGTGADVFVYDRQLQSTERVSLAAGGIQGNANSGDPSISADGRYVAFLGVASNLVTGDTNGVPDIFVHDRQADTIERVSVATGGAQGNDISQEPAISGDGRYVAFESTASNLAPGDTNGVSDIFVYDRQSDTIERIAVTVDATQPNGSSITPSISADGRYVSFISQATNLVAGDTNGAIDAFVYDRQAGTIKRVSVNADGIQGDNQSADVAIAADAGFVAFSSAAANLVAGDTNGTFDIFAVTLDDVPPKLSIAAASAAEGNAATSNLLFTISLSRTAAQAVTVTATTANGTAIAGSDYTAKSQQVTIPAGELSASFSVAVTGDTTVETDETLTVTLSSPSNAALGLLSSATGTIANDDSAVLPVLSIAAASATEGTSGSVNLVFTVTLSQAAAQAVTVTAATANGTAVAGSDFAATSQQLTIPAGQTTAQLSVALTGDTRLEGDEVFVVALSNPSANAAISPTAGRALGTIVNDDAGVAPAVDGAMTTGDGGPNAIAGTTANDRLEGGSGADTLTGGEGADILDGGAGDDSIIGDGSLAPPTAPPSLTIANVSVNEGNGGTVNAVFTISLSAASSQTVSVTASTANGTAIAGSDYVVANQVVTIAAGQTSATFAVQVIGDTAVEANETFTVGLSNPVNATLGSPSSAAGTIQNDDSAPPPPPDPPGNFLPPVAADPPGAKDDSILGGDGADFVDGGEGEDTIFGGNGNDFLVGNADNDTIFGEAGDDFIDGVDGGDYVFAGAGGDIVVGGSFFETGSDIIDVGDGTNFAFGGGGNDTLVGGAGNDLLAGEPGDDLIRGGDGDNALFGGDGNDSIEGGEGGDIVFGQLGNDAIVTHGGFDLIIEEPIAAAGENDAIDVGDGGSQIFAGAGNDTILAGNGGDFILGESGADSIAAGNGDDALIAGPGNDTLDGGAGNDLLIAEGGNDSLTGGAGNDLFRYPAGIAVDADRIADFTPADDTVELAASLGYANAAAARGAVQQVGADAVLVLTGGTITFVGLAAASLIAADFVIV